MAPFVMRHRPYHWLLLVAVASVQPFGVVQVRAQQHVIVIDHHRCLAAVPEPLKGFETAPAYVGRSLKDDCAPTGRMNLQPGDLVTVRVVNTVASAFTLTVRGVLPVVDTAATAPPTSGARPRPVLAGGAGSDSANVARLGSDGLTSITDPAALHKLVAAVCNRDSITHRTPDEQRFEVSLGCLSEARDTLTVTFVHDEKYGGYVLQLTPVAGPLQPPYLGAVTYDLQVRTSKVVIVPDAGFVFSGLRDHAYSVAQATGDTTHVLTEDKGRRDVASYGVLTVLVVHHTTWWPWLGAAFGVGAMKNGTAAFFLGPAFRAGEVATMSMGLAYGTVNAPPAGVVLGATPVGSNALSQLTSRAGVSYFVSITFRFLGGTTEAVQRAYAGQQPSGASPAPGAPR